MPKPIATFGAVTFGITRCCHQKKFFSSLRSTEVLFALSVQRKAVVRRGCPDYSDAEDAHLFADTHIKRMEFGWLFLQYCDTK
jgi:hypothetical protein